MKGQATPFHLASLSLSKKKKKETPTNNNNRQRWRGNLELVQGREISSLRCWLCRDRQGGGVEGRPVGWSGGVSLYKQYTHNISVYNTSITKYPIIFTFVGSWTGEKVRRSGPNTHSPPSSSLPPPYLPPPSFYIDCLWARTARLQSFANPTSHDCVSPFPFPAPPYAVSGVCVRWEPCPPPLSSSSLSSVASAIFTSSQHPKLRRPCVRDGKKKEQK